MQSIQHFFSGISVPTITTPSFTRGSGCWSSTEDERDNSFFGQLTDMNSQRENWYAVTPYVAEFWCTVSNVAIVGSGIICNSPELVFAGLASTVSHTVPKQWLLKIDKLGVALVALRVLKEYQVILNDPKLVVLPLAAMAINYADIHLARSHGISMGHVVWHCASGLLTGYFLSQASSYDFR